MPITKIHPPITAQPPAGVSAWSHEQNLRVGRTITIDGKEHYAIIILTTPVSPELRGAKTIYQQLKGPNDLSCRTALGISYLLDSEQYFLLLDGQKPLSCWLRCDGDPPTWEEVPIQLDPS